MFTAPSHTPANILPFLLQLGLVQPPKQFQRIRATTKSQNIGRTPYGIKDTFSETTGPFKTRYAWKQLDFKYPSEAERDIAISSGDFIPENNLPLGIEVWKNRLFVTMPKWKNGVPATLAVIPRDPLETSPQLVPYPSWDWHTTGK